MLLISFSFRQPTFAFSRIINLYSIKNCLRENEKRFLEKMSQDMCRLCLSKDNLCPIFVDVEQKQRYTYVLGLTTGLKIELDDGLPQQICDDCTDLVNSALNLRNQSHYSEMKLISSKYKRKNENNVEETETSKEIEGIFENNTELAEDCFNFDGFKIKVELDRLTEQNGEENIKKAKDIDEQPKTEKDVKEVNKMTVKEKRAMYMSYVDGPFNPKGPIKCKTCKQSLSKWACFTNHVKKHLGSKIVCEYCGKSLISLHQLKRHCRSYHGMQREHKCRHCGYLALDSVQLLMHERRQHTGERPYVCDICAAAYFNRKCLLQHLENHRTTVTVQCDSCPQQFKSRRHLAKHRYSAHGDKGRKRRRERRHLNNYSAINT